MMVHRNTSFASSDDAASTTAEEDRRLLDQLLLMTVVHSLLREEGTDADEGLKKMARELIDKREDDLSSVSKELFAITERMLNINLLRLLESGEKDQDMLLSCVGASGDHQLNAANAKKKSAAAAKKKRSKRKKAAAKQKKTKHNMSWLGSNRIIPLVMMAAFGSITTLMTFSLIPQSDGSSEGNDPPTLPPSASTSLGQRNSETIISPTLVPAEAVRSLIFTRTTDVEDSNLSNELNSDNVSVVSISCVDTPNWTDKVGNGCDHYEASYQAGCPGTEKWAGIMGPATEHCCYCMDPTLKKNFTCDDAKVECNRLSTFRWTAAHEQTMIVCDEAASCSCGEDQFTITTDVLYNITESAGLHNECKCDFWLGLCEDMHGGEACDHAAESCCGDYRYDSGVDTFRYLNSPVCYCDFYNYAKIEFGHTIKARALGVDKDFTYPCSGLEVDWLNNADVQRESLIAIYNATNGQNWTNNAGWLDDRIDYCLWYGIDCDENGYVVGIDLKDNNLVGQFPVYTRTPTFDSMGNVLRGSEWQYSKYGLANFYKLELLELANNKLMGTIEYLPLYNLQDLTYFDVSGNQLSGEVDALVGTSLIYADFSNNGFTSMRHLRRFKASFHILKAFNVTSNGIHQNLTEILEHIPPNIDTFSASHNQIYGNLPASFDTLPKLKILEMAYNVLSGDVPGLTESYLTLHELDLSYQKKGFGFTGSIPKNLWLYVPLKKLNLAGNRLTGTIPSLVRNFAVMEELDLSNNDMGSILPPELGMLGGKRYLKHLALSNNAFTGTIPFQIGQLKGASVLMKDNLFHNTTICAPLNLCLETEVKEFDLAIDTTLCPPERNALTVFYDDAKGMEWTNGSLWLDEYASYCDWKGVTCDDEMNVIKLNLTNNGLSGKLSKTIGNLTSMKELDLSDNNMQASLPAELGELSNLVYLRLSYNEFTGAVPETLSTIKGLQLLQLQANRITKIPNIPRLSDAIYADSTFVADCGVPTDFEYVLNCDNCTMCCNADGDCKPQEETLVEKWGLRSYGTFAIALSIGFILLCCVSALLLFIRAKRKILLLGDSLTSEMETRMKEDDMYALGKIGKDSVYSYFVTDKYSFVIVAIFTLAMQFGLLVIFIRSSEADLQNDKTDIQFTWLCPRDSDVCKNTTSLTTLGWIFYSLLMVANLGKDVISGSKLIYHSTKITYCLIPRMRYFFGGVCLCWFTLFALYVSTVYNKAIATSNTEIIVNAVIVLFVTEMDEWIFSLLEAINEKWTELSADSEKEPEMKEEIERQKEQIASQQEEIDNQRNDIQRLNEAMETIQSQVACLGLWQLRFDKKDFTETTIMTASDIESAKCVINTGPQQMENVDPITLLRETEEQEVKELNAAATTSPKTISTCNTFESMATNGSGDIGIVGSDTHAGKGGVTNEMEGEENV